MKHTNLKRALLFRLLAIGFVLYYLADTIIKFFQGGEGSPDLLLVILSCVFLGGGAALIAVLTWKDWKGLKEEDEEEESASEEE